MASRPAKHGQSWTLTDYETLVRSVRDGVPLDHVTKALERSPGSVNSRIQLFDDSPSFKVSDPTGAFDRGLANLRNESYDWRSRVNAYCAAQGLTLWDDTVDALLRDYWNRGIHDVEELASVIGSNANQVTRRLKELGIVVKPRPAEDSHPVGLVVIDDTGEVHWTSKHLDEAAAVEMLISMIPEAATALAHGSTWKWTITLSPRGWTAQVLSSGAFVPATSRVADRRESARQHTSSRVLTSDDPSTQTVCPRCAAEKGWKVPLHRLRSLTESPGVDQYHCLFGHIVHLRSGREIDLPVSDEPEEAPDDDKDLDDWGEDGDTQYEIHQINSERIDFWDRYSTDDEVVHPSEYADPGYWMSQDEYDQDEDEKRD